MKNWYFEAITMFGAAENEKSWFAIFGDRANDFKILLNAILAILTAAAVIFFVIRVVKTAAKMQNAEPEEQAELKRGLMNAAIWVAVAFVGAGGAFAILNALPRSLLGI